MPAMDQALMIFIVSGIAIFLTSFNVFTIFIFIGDRKLRKLTSSYPIVSFLIGSAIQGMLAAPTYIAKKLVGKENLVVFLCDVYRFPYILCEHSMKFSLMIVGIDRLLAIKMPFRYKDSVTSKKIIMLLVLSWLVTIAVDVIPFLHSNKSSECKYNMTRIWGLVVICIYNFLPFFVIIVCYAWIWQLAARMSFQDKRRNESLRRTNRSQDEEEQNLTSIPLENTTTEDDVFAEASPTPSSTRSPLKRSWRQISKKASNSAQTVRYAFEMKATKTSLMILAVYVICWGPLGVFYTIDHFCHDCLSDNENIHISRTRMAIKILCFFSSLIAPLVYCWRMNHFKRRVKSVCCSLICGLGDRSLMKSSNSRSTNSSSSY